LNVRTSKAAEVVTTGLMDLSLPFILDAEVERMSVHGLQLAGRLSFLVSLDEFGNLLELVGGFIKSENVSVS